MICLFCDLLNYSLLLLCFPRNKLVFLLNIRKKFICLSSTFTHDTHPYSLWIPIKNNLHFKNYKIVWIQGVEAFGGSLQRIHFSQLRLLCGSSRADLRLRARINKGPNMKGIQSPVIDWDIYTLHLKSLGFNRDD